MHRHYVIEQVWRAPINLYLQQMRRPVQLDQGERGMVVGSERRALEY